MYAIFSTLEDCEKAIQEYLNESSVDFVISGINHKNEITLSGDDDSIKMFANFLKKKKNIYSKKLKVQGGFHSNIFKSIEEEFEKSLEELEIDYPEIPIMSIIDGQIHKKNHKIKENLVQQLTSPVLFYEAIKKCLEKGATSFYELSHKRILTNHILKIGKDFSFIGI